MIFNTKGYSVILLPIILGVIAISSLAFLSNTILSSIKIDKKYEMNLRAELIKKPLRFLMNKQINCDLNFKNKTFNKDNIISVNNLSYLIDEKNPGSKNELFKVGSDFNDFKITNIFIKQGNLVKSGSTTTLGWLSVHFEKGDEKSGINVPIYLTGNATNINQIEQCFTTALSHENKTIEDIMCRVNLVASPTDKVIYDPSKLPPCSKL